MELEFTEEQMTKFLQRRAYKIAHWPGRVKATSEETQDILVAFLPIQYGIIKEMELAPAIQEVFGIEVVFRKELAKLLARL